MKNIILTVLLATSAIAHARVKEFMFYLFQTALADPDLWKENSNVQKSPIPGAK